LQGYQNRRRLLALWGGLKYQDVGLTPVEMEYLNGLKFLRTDYYIVFRVPPAMIYEVMPVEMGKGNEATDSAKVQWWEDVGLSELDIIAALHQPIVDRFFRQGSGGRVGRSLMRSERGSCRRFMRRSIYRAGQNDDQYSLWFDENSIPALARYRLGKIDQMAKVLAMGYPPDEVNDLLDLDLPPHPDNIGRIPFNLQPVGAEPTPGAEAEAPPGGRRPPSETPNESQEAANRAKALLNRAEELCRADVSAKYAGVRTAFEAYLKPREKAAAKKWSGFFVEQRGRVLERVKTIQRSDGSVGLDVLLMRAAADDEIKKLFPRRDEDSQLVMRITPVLREHLVDGIKFLGQEIGVQIENSMAIDSDPRLMAALRDRQIQGLQVNDTTEDALRGIIQKNFEAGGTTLELGDAIAGYYKDHCVGAESVRPMTAARTQTAGIVNEGRMLAAEEVGGLKKGWLHGGSKEPRESHMAAQREYLGSPIPLNEKFRVGGYECDAPGSTELPVEEVANCSCMVVFTKG
jgi:hypothetical protein